MRITDKDLEAVVKRINSVTGMPLEPYANIDGKFVAQIGNYHLSHAYGGVCLHRMQTDGGGVQDVFSSGHETKRELYNRMQAFLIGMFTEKEIPKPIKDNRPTRASAVARKTRI